ncbi:sporulation histidine kinase inhibitor Sda [Neobacillus sp. DY30]|uniref:sporulation histidine kinase inhibitor Sda n=1 Tax=Neobacillus sp. DY30 TaxID=3047871 RepID=UPI0024BF70E9|nr:sporulation histidine kinase inhibitor Sda [Neobacillus sp. DY30]WHX98175.1 sporulation histidine kinase inhibitor Sda [Neobacillus sp. DY30]
MFSSLGNKVLIDTYFNAVRLKLDEDFIQLLEEEIDRRGIQLDTVERMVKP